MPDIQIKSSSEFDVNSAEAHQLSIWESFGQEEPPPPENLTFSVNCIDDWPLVNPDNNKNTGTGTIISNAKNLRVAAPAGYFTTFEEDGSEVAHDRYVGDQEWKLFVVLRRMALEKGGYQKVDEKGDNRFYLPFRIRELARFYKESTGKTVRTDHVKQRLEVLRTAVYQIRDKHSMAHFSLLDDFFLASRSDIAKDPNAMCYVVFDKMTEKTLTEGSGTLIDYDLACQLPHMASWFYSKLERAGLQITLRSGVPYKLWLRDTLYRVGLNNSTKPVKRLKRDVTESLKLLIERGVIRKFSFTDKHQATRGRPKLIDSEISIEITPEFESRIKSKKYGLKEGRKDGAGIKTNYVDMNKSSIASKLVKLHPHKIVGDEDGWVGLYQRSEEPRRQDSVDEVPEEAEFRNDHERRIKSDPLSSDHKTT